MKNKNNLKFIIFGKAFICLFYIYFILRVKLIKNSYLKICSIYIYKNIVSSKEIYQM